MNLLAEAPISGESMNWVTALFQMGVAGVLLWWFMSRSEPRLRAIEASIDRITRALIVLSFAISNALEAINWNHASSIKPQAHAIEKELDDAAKAREQNQ